MDNKKMVSLKSLLLRAWRERWPDTYWSIQAKHVLNNCSEADQVSLTDLLLQQALVGSSPNLMVLSYFKHAVNTQMITYTIGLEGIVKFEDASRVYCMKALVELVEGLLPRVCLNGNHEDSFALGCACLRVVRWLLSLAQECIQKVVEDQQGAEYATVAVKSTTVLGQIREDQSLLALIYIVHMEEKGVHQNIKEIESNLRNALSSLDSTHLNLDHRLKMQDSLDIVHKIGTRTINSGPILDPTYQPLNASVNVLLHIEAVLNPTGEIQAFADQLNMLRQIQGVSFPSLYCDMLRTCFMGMIDAHGGSDELKWAAFTFLKMPQLLLRLSRMSGTEAGDVMQGLEMFLNYLPLLDLTDTKCNVDCVELMCTELKSDSIQLLSQTQWLKITERRKQERDSSVKLDGTSSQQGGLPSPNLILRAEPTIKTMLRTLDADYSKNLEQLCTVMGQMMSGKSFDLLLTSAAATGKLHAFAAALIKFNEQTKYFPGETSEVAQTRANSFDIMFLMLCHIAQTYGIEICHNNESMLENSFFVQWAQQCLPEDGQYKPLNTNNPIDNQRIDVLINQLQPNNGLKISLTRWNEVMYNVRIAIQEILFAWEYGALNQEQIKAILMTLKNKMCCLAVSVASFLCSYINIVEHERQQKPIQMLEMLLQPPIQNAEPVMFYNERSHLLHVILTKLVQDILPVESPHHVTPAHAIPRDEPLLKVVTETWGKVFSTGIVTTGQLLRLENVLNVSGSQWFCTNLVKEVLKEERIEDLYKGACLLYSLFSYDLTNLTLCLMHHTIPSLLHQSSAAKLITGPRGLVLAKLCVSCMLLLQSPTQSPSQGDTPTKKSRKRTRTEVELEDSDFDSMYSPYMRPSKIRRSESSTPVATHNIDDCILIEDSNGSTTTNADGIVDTLDLATAGLLRVFSNIIQGQYINERTHFVRMFLEEVVKSGEQLTQYVVQFVPPNMVTQLMKLLPSQFDLDLLLSVCDLSSSQGRKVACKVVCQNEQLQRRRITVTTVAE